MRGCQCSGRCSMARPMEMVSGGARIPDGWQPHSSWSFSVLRWQACTCPLLTEMPTDDGRIEHLHALCNDDGRCCHVLHSRPTQLPELKICSDNNRFLSAAVDPSKLGQLNWLAAVNISYLFPRLADIHIKRNGRSSSSRARNRSQSSIF